MNSWQTLFEGSVGDRLVKAEKNGTSTIRVKVTTHDNHAEVPVVAASLERLKEALVQRGLFKEEDAQAIVASIPAQSSIKPPAP